MEPVLLSCVADLLVYTSILGNVLVRETGTMYI